MRFNKGIEMGLPAILQWFFVIIVLSALVLVFIGTVVKINVNIDTATEARTAFAWADLMASSKEGLASLDEEGLPKKAVLNSTKLRYLEENCTELEFRFVDRDNKFGITVIDENNDKIWTICDFGTISVPFPVLIEYPNGDLHGGKLIVSYSEGGKGFL